MVGALEDAGDQKLDAVGTMYRRNRHYDPASGRFTQEDPIGIAGRLNGYGFGHGDAVNYVDPFGLLACFGTEDNQDRRDMIDEVKSATGTEFTVHQTGSRKGCAKNVRVNHPWNYLGHAFKAIADDPFLTVNFVWGSGGSRIVPGVGILIDRSDANRTYESDFWCSQLVPVTNDLAPAVLHELGHVWASNYLNITNRVANLAVAVIWENVANVRAKRSKRHVMCAAHDAVIVP